MDKKTLAILIPISFLLFVGGLMIGLYYNLVGYFIMIAGTILTFQCGIGMGKIKSKGL